MRKTLFILSSKAGKTEFDINEKDIEKIYDKKYFGENIKIIKTKYENHAIDAAKSFINKYINFKKTIIVGGGDGSLNEICNVIYENDLENTSLGLIPMGTGNDFSKNFPYKNFKLESLLNIKEKKIDLIKVNGKVGINVLSLGFDTVVLKKAYEYLDKKPSLGKKAYFFGVIKSLKHLSYQNLYLTLYDKNNEKINIKDDFLLSAICNGGYYGSGFNPAPSAKIDDGILNLVFAKKLPNILLPSLIIRYKFGLLENSKYLDEIKIKKGKIKSDRPILANIDGEIFQSEEINFKIIEKALTWSYLDM
ncbi:diacylglycerol kinase family protein [Anaerococcus hydrogenalis]|uniref:diacylglycerol/lipid kinase family protein n=1 Tax=Anaerococcus hydrogenalis TaxID=33029 RepID=UPI002903FCD3|nr:diacylglycerol kinase family protein [Anaerococcus hydrogenalis]MDU1316541.1 diacylglycerol kinase family protein [Anaerococcus hydrogenalis]